MKAASCHVSWLELTLGGLILAGWWLMSAHAFPLWVYVGLAVFVLVPCVVQDLNHIAAFRHRLVVVAVAFLTYAILVTLGHPHPVEPSIAAAIGALIGATLPPRHVH